MLVQFKFKNFGPFKDEAVFDMRAINTYKEHPYNLITPEMGKNSYIKVAAIYGANASGKSNFVDAYNCFFNIVTSSFNSKNKENITVLEENYHPFLFSPDTSNAETEFEGTYRLEDFEYNYGFIYDKTEIKCEWLYRRSIITGRLSTLIERSRNGIELGASVKKTCDKYIPEIDKDVLVLSFFNRLKLRTHVFNEAYFCVADILPLKFASDRYTDSFLDIFFKYDYNDTTKSELLSFLNAIDVGIKNISVERNQDKIQVFSHHIGINGEDYRVPFSIESDGTRKAIAVFAIAQIAVKNNKGIIVDELNMQLHPLLLKFIVDLFYDENTKGQLIYTTHDTTLLDKRYFRRDQVWFTNKKEDGSSELYSLAEFKIRKDESFEKEYLSGMFGGVPILKDFSMEGNFNGL